MLVDARARTLTSFQTDEWVVNSAERSQVELGLVHAPTHGQSERAELSRRRIVVVVVRRRRRPSRHRWPATGSAWHACNGSFRSQQRPVRDQSFNRPSARISRSRDFSLPLAPPSHLTRHALQHACRAASGHTVYGSPMVGSPGSTASPTASAARPPALRTASNAAMDLSPGASSLAPNLPTAGPQASGPGDDRGGGAGGGGGGADTVTEPSEPDVVDMFLSLPSP